MKTKRQSKILLSLALLMILHLSVLGQVNINISNTPQTTCSANYFDSGGPSGSYLNGESFTQTFTPSIAGNAIQIAFTAFSTESGFDFFRIFNGPSTGSPLLGTFSGSTLPGTFTSTAAGGELTFQF